MALNYISRLSNSIFKKRHCWQHLRCRAISSYLMNDQSSIKEVEVKLGEQTLKLITGKLGEFSNGAAIAELGRTTVLSTVTCQELSSSHSSALTVFYQLGAYEFARRPINYLGRELGTENHTLTSRMIEHSVRPLFPEGLCCSTELACHLLGMDKVNDPDVACINAASAALSVSEIPWKGPIGAVKVGLLGDVVVINPTRRQLKESSLNVIITGTTNRKIVMLEGEADRVGLEKVEKALSEALNVSQTIIDKITALRAAVGKPKRECDPPVEPPQQVVDAVQSFSLTDVQNILFNTKHDKTSRDTALKAVGETVVRNVKSSLPDEDVGVISSCYHDFVKKVLKDMVLNEERRCDGRALDNPRRIACILDYISGLTSSVLFNQGQTQVLSAVTLDALKPIVPDQTLVTRDNEDKFTVIYGFPPYATNEIGPVDIERELDRGALVKRCLNGILPQDAWFRTLLSCKVLAYDGSSSMISVSCGSVALIHAGIPIKEAAVGVNMGLVTCSDTRGNIEDYKIVTDLLAIEESITEMNLKIAGTKTGLTALRADIKIPGIELFIIIKALESGFSAIRRILKIMSQSVSSPRKRLTPCGPVRGLLDLDVERQTRLLGRGGYNLHKLKIKTGVTVTRTDEGFDLFAPNIYAMGKAEEMIETILQEQVDIIITF